MKKLLILVLIAFCSGASTAQPGDCVFQPPIVTINFGTGYIGDRNATPLANYRHVTSYCPTDGHYTYASYTSECFRGDWVTLTEDHTPGDVDGNMLLVNAAPGAGTFLTTTISRLKPGTIYEFSVWMMNLCRPTDKCPFPLLPDITIMLLAGDGKVVVQFGTGELVRREVPQWTRYEALFTTPASETTLTLVMNDNNPGGCGNDFALDDLSFRECVKVPPVVTKVTKTPPAKTPHTKTSTVVRKPVETPKPPVTNKKIEEPKITTVIKKPADTPKTVVRKEPVAPPPVKRTTPVAERPKPLPSAKPPVAVAKKPPVSVPPVEKDLPRASQTTVAQPKISPDSSPVIKPRVPVLPPPPALIATRANPLIKLIETGAGDIKIDLYDNGEIDGDTISVYHNNVLQVSRARISQTPITFHVTMDAAHPHHELVMVAHNLGSIPPNTSLMVVTALGKRYEVFISSTEQKNAKVVLDLKE